MIKQSFSSLKKIQKGIGESWTKETCYYPSLWCKNNKSRSSGQCRITALLIQELLGGKILYSHVIKNKELDHYWNKIGDLEIDLTSKQFKKGTRFIKPKVLSRKKVFGDDRITLKTYKILRDNYLKKQGVKG
jgi:hypothetical protein